MSRLALAMLLAGLSYNIWHVDLGPHASVEFSDANFNFCPKVSEGRDTFQYFTTNFLLCCFD
jgi:hypothetical protein